MYQMISTMQPTIYPPIKLADISDNGSSLVFVFFDHFSLFSSLHNHWNGRDSIDLHVFNVPKLLNSSYQLQEQMRHVTREHPIGLNGKINIKNDTPSEKQLIQKRINELESELNHLKSQLRPNSNSSVH
jgi:hypothetical protein